MKKLLAILFVSVSPAFAQVSNLPPNQFMASPSAVPGKLAPRAIISADLAASPIFTGTISGVIETLAGTFIQPALPGLSTAVPFPSAFSGPATFGLALPSATNPWVITGTASSTATDNAGGLLYVAKTTTYGTAALGPGTAPAIYGYNQVADGVWGNQQGILGTIYNDNTQHSQPNSTASAVAMYGMGICNVANCSATWGSVMAGYDTSGQANPPSALYGLEVDNYANGTDSNSERIGLQVTAGKFNPTGAVNVVTHLVLLGSSASVATYGNVIEFFGTAVNGLNLNGGTFTGASILSPGFSVDPSGNVVGLSFSAGASSGVSCAAGTVSLTTLVVTKGIVTHC